MLFILMALDWLSSDECSNNNKEYMSYLCNNPKNYSLSAHNVHKFNQLDCLELQIFRKY